MKKKTRLLSLILTVVILISIIPITLTTSNAATFDQINDGSVFLKQEGSSTCTLCAAAMMLRRTAYLRGDSNWASITESAIKSTAWSNGLRWNFIYSNITVNHASISGSEAQKQQTLINLLTAHPEGIVLYYQSSSKQHAVLLTDYTNGVFYCADPYGGKASGRIPLSQCLYVTVANCNYYWYVSSPKVYLSDYVPPIVPPDPDPGTASDPNPILNPNDPIAKLDGIEGGVGTVTVWGWSFDPDTPNPTAVHIYVNGPAGDPNAECIGIFADGLDRPDVKQAYPQCQGTLHGFHAQVRTSKRGTNIPVYLYAINMDGTPGNNVCFANTTVTITSPEPTPPAFTRCEIASHERTTYRIVAVPEDDLQVEKIVCATWTLDNHMSDLKWQNLTRLSDGHYILDIQRDQFSQSKNSVYINDVYLYYVSGTEVGMRLIQDYRLEEKSPHLLNDGDYRIVYSLDDSLGLDVYGSSSNAGTNIQLYKNTKDNNQIFRLTYTDDGYYKITNTHSSKAVEVKNDTYQPNTTVIQNDDAGTDNQKWLIYAVENNCFCIKARSNGLALSSAVREAANGTDVRVETYKGIASQHWKIKRVLKNDMVIASDISYIKDKETPEPVVTVTVDGITLDEGTDYTADISINGSKGVATITGIGSYCGTITKEFSVQEIEETPTDPPTQPSTQAPTQPATQAPTEVPTQPATTAPTVEPTENPDQPADVPYDECDPYFEVSDVSATVGEEICVDVAIRNNPGITSYSFDLTYPSALTLTSVDYKTLFSTKPTSSNKLQSPYKISWYSTASENEAKNGVIATLHFKVSDTAAIGQYPIKLTYDEENIFAIVDSGFENVKFGTKSGTVTVQDHVPGDINGDKKVNMKDIVLLQQYFNDWDVEVNRKYADVNGDNNVNMKDIVLLQQFINGWEVILK